METREKVLVIRLKSIGDIVFTLPAVNRLRAEFPAAEFHFLVSREHATLLEGFRAVDQVITLDRQKLRRFNPFAMAGEILRLGRRLRTERFSLVVDLQGYGETGLMTWYTGAPKRWGTVYRRQRSWAYTQPVLRDPEAHPAQSHLDLLARCGLTPTHPTNEFALPGTALEEARRIFASHGLRENRPAVFVQPFTSTAEKDWPLEQYLAIAAKLKERGQQVLFSGGPADREALEPARQQGWPVTAGTPLLVTGGLMKLSNLVLGGDTGVLHLAVALGKRVLMLMTSTGPGSCYPFLHCDWTLVPKPGSGMAGLEQEAVERAVSDALGEGKG